MATHVFDLERIGDGLPVAASREELERAIKGPLVVTAPPGTGKTTFVPPLAANQLALGSDYDRVLLTQPRRVAVRAAARRLADLDGTQLGGPVGFTVRGERNVSADTRIEVVTPGVLLRRLIADPELDGVGAVILDEVHERSVDSDVLVGMLAEVRELRDDLGLVAMSATLDAEVIASVLGGKSGPASTVEIPARLYPLEVDYAPFAGARLTEHGVARDYLAHLARTTLDAQSAAAATDSGACDALVFVPGAREVDEVVRLLCEATRSRCQASPFVDILPLHGRLPAAQQDRAVQGRSPNDAPRIVVSTALAESSLTVPGVRLVVDAGLSREVRRDRARDMTGLVTVSTSRASAEQRAGRAARQGPGRAVRVYSETDFARMPRAAAPEIASADLVDTALLLAAWGTPGGLGLRLPSAPPPAAMDDAIAVLRNLELVDASGRLTPAGFDVVRLPVGVREARALLQGAKELTDVRLASELVAAIVGDHREPGADLTRLLRELRAGRAERSVTWRREAQRLARLVDAEPGTRAARDGSANQPPLRDPAPERPELANPAGVVVALARPEWIARRANGDRGGRASYLLASGTRAALPAGSELAESEWLAVGEVQRASGRGSDGTGAIIRLAAPLTEAEARYLGRTLQVQGRSARMSRGRVFVREESRLGAIPLAEVPVPPTPADTAPAVLAHLRETGVSSLSWPEGAESLRGRLALLHRVLGDPWPDVRDEALLQRLDEWLGPDLARMRPDAPLHGLDTEPALRRLLPWPGATRLDELAPERLLVPSGSRIRIEYPAPDDAEALPVVAVKLQETFGLAETPRLVNGAVPVVFHLLSPARRPLAVTSDLRSFWDGPYQEVRKEMRGRYPKHPWPADPWTAQATARTDRDRGAARR